ncbi:hypothetical protein [Bacillus sp. B15-48]|uniref:magnesium chelatase subunit ChlI family protein n=1 Tax=Bacillus sp. B15-48 TaxID=1548601 RepID=UPI0031B8559B|nr:hypothetical protein [Bacillus sp. B15-48]
MTTNYTKTALKNNLRTCAFLPHFLSELAAKHDWSNRRQVKIIRIAQTIAGLNQQPEITTKHILEASALSQL